MILKKKVSAITTMMVLLGGVLCNSESIASGKKTSVCDFQSYFSQKLSQLRSSANVGQQKINDTKQNQDDSTGANNKLSFNKLDDNTHFDMADIVSLISDAYEDEEPKTIEKAKQIQSQIKNFQDDICKHLMVLLKQFAYGGSQKQNPMLIFEQVVNLWSSSANDDKQQKKMRLAIFDTAASLGETSHGNSVFFDNLMQQTFFSTIENSHEALSNFFQELGSDICSINKTYKNCEKVMSQCDSIINKGNNPIQISDLEGQKNAIEGFLTQFKQQPSNIFTSKKDDTVNAIASCIIKKCMPFIAGTIKKYLKKKTNNQ